MSIPLEILRVSQKPTGIELSEHKSIEIDFSGNGSSLDDWRKGIMNVKSTELKTLLGRLWPYWVARVQYKLVFTETTFPKVT